MSNEDNVSVLKQSSEHINGLKEEKKAANLTGQNKSRARIVFKRMTAC